MADDEKNPIEEAEAVEAPAADETVAEPAPEPPVRDSGPREGVPGEPGGSPGEAQQPREKKPKSRRHVPRAERRQRSKPRREAPTTRKPIVRGDNADVERGRRQERRGVVVSDKADKTIVVKV